MVVYFDANIVKFPEKPLILWLNMDKIIVTYRKTSRLSMRIGKNGEVRVSAPYFAPKNEIERFVESNRDWIAKAQAKMTKLLETRQGFYAKLPLTTKSEKQAAMEKLDAIIQPMLEKHVKIMGVCPSKIEYKATISQWGSCQSKTKRILFSLYLLLLPEICIEQVVVHELAHLIVPNHGEKFYAVMDKYFPAWKEARKLARKISRS